MSRIPLLPDPQAALYRQARQSPMLDADQENQLVRAWREKGDEKARRQLVESHLRLVIKTAGQFKGYGLAAQDLIAEGSLGLVRALDGFDPERGLRFSTYAQWWIRAAMFEYVLKFSTPVSFGLSAERKRLFFKLRGIKARLGLGGGLTPEDHARIGQSLKVAPQKVAEMEQLLGQSPKSLDQPVGEDGLTLADSLADDAQGPEEIHAERQELMYRRDLFNKAFTHLNEREQTIIRERALSEEPQRLEDLAQRFKISRERVRQIEAGAMKKLKNLVSAALPKPARHT